jgi:outer membrane autotransporter protein
VDANILANQADVLITGAATGSTILDVNLVGGLGFNTTGTLVVDGTAGTASSAFTLNAITVANPFVHIDLLFDSPNNNFLLVALPAQPVFETTMTGETILNLWYNSADAVTAQLQAARDGNTLPVTSSLAGDGRFGGWVQMIAGRVSRDTSQTFGAGATSSVFNTSYDQEMWGVQGGLDYQSGGTILGATFGYEKSTVDFDTSFNRVTLSAYNVGAYAAFQSGPFYINAIGKYDWINADARPGAGFSATFDATSWGLRGNAGLHLNLGNFFVEPGLSLSWVETNIDDYAVAGASVHFNDIHSLRGSAGIRIGADIDAGPGSTLSPYVGVQAVNEFEGRLRNTITLGQAIALEQDAPGTFGELSGGVTLRRHMLEAFIRAEADFGSHRDALTGRAGLRVRF